MPRMQLTDEEVALIRRWRETGSPAEGILLLPFIHDAKGGVSVFQRIGVVSQLPHGVNSRTDED